MPFGQNCQFQDFAACTAALRGKVDDPEAACGALQRDYECSGQKADDGAPFAKAAEHFAKEWSKMLPRTGRAQPFALDEQRIDGAAGQKLAQCHWRFFSPTLKACWGFTTLGLPETPGARVLAFPKVPSSQHWLTGDIDSARFLRKASGRYRVSLAADDFIEVFARAGDHFSGRYTFQKDAEAGCWICTRGPNEASIVAGMDPAVMLRELKKRRFQKALVPRDTLDLSMGLRFIDLPREHGRTVTVRAVLKAAEEQRYTLGIAYPVKEVDAHGEYATAQEVEKAAWRYMANRQVGLMHRDGTEGAGTLVESYIYRGPKWAIDGQTVDPGDWLIGVIWEPPAWDLIKSGAITGFSIQGWAKKPS